MTAGEPGGNVDDDLHGKAAFARHSLYIYMIYIYIYTVHIVEIGSDPCAP